MLLFSFTVVFLMLGAGVGVQPAPAHAQSELRLPLGAEWRSTLAQIEQLPSLERQADGSLKVSTTIRSGPEIVLYATWQARTITFRIDRNFGLYALGIEFVPEAVQHAPETDDSELPDLTYRAPMRLAVVNKYGRPQALTSQWDDLDASPLPDAGWKKANVIDWSYAMSWLVWRGQETRIAVGEQEVWYVSRALLNRRRRARALLEQHALTAHGVDLVRQAEHQQRLDRARGAIPTRAEALEPLL